MARALIASLAIVLTTGVTTLEVPVLSAAQQPVATADSQPSPAYDAQAERQLLDMANRERVKAGLPTLRVDEGLAKAAREHGAAMAAQQKLSHQLSGELNLEHRLAANTKAHLDQSGENVAFAPSVDQAQDNLMHSPPHRANLLNANYNVAGFSVVRNGSLLYVTQDFGHSLPSRSAIAVARRDAAVACLAQRRPTDVAARRRDSVRGGAGRCRWHGERPFSGCGYLAGDGGRSRPINAAPGAATAGWCDSELESAVELRTGLG